jgi:hypothetical protein
MSNNPELVFKLLSDLPPWRRCRSTPTPAKRFDEIAADDFTFAACVPKQNGSRIPLESGHRAKDVSDGVPLFGQRQPLVTQGRRDPVPGVMPQRMTCAIKRRPFEEFVAAANCAISALCISISFVLLSGRNRISQSRGPMLWIGNENAKLRQSANSRRMNRLKIAFPKSQCRGVSRVDAGSTTITDCADALRICAVDSTCRSGD